VVGQAARGQKAYASVRTSSTVEALRSVRAKTSAHAAGRSRETMPGSTIATTQSASSPATAAASR